MATYEPKYLDNEVGRVYGYFLKSRDSNVRGFYTDLTHREYLLIDETSIPVTALFGREDENSANIIVPVIDGEKVPARFCEITADQAKRLSHTRKLPLAPIRSTTPNSWISSRRILH